MVASDKLFFWLFQQHAERIEPLVASVLPGIERMEGYSFTAPVLKEREHRLDGLFLPPAHRTDQPALILEAQMAASPDFLLRVYAESARLLQQQQRQQRPIRDWRVLVICPRRDLNYGDPLPVREFLRERVIWIELLPERLPAVAPPLQRALSLLLLPEAEVRRSSEAIRAEVCGSPLEREIDDVIAAILVSRFSGRTLQEICAMGGITVEDFTSSVAYREIYGLGRDEGHQAGRQEGLQAGRQEGLQAGRQEGRRAEAAALTLRLLERRCGPLAPTAESRIRALSLEALEALADALLEFGGPEDLEAWLAGQVS